MTNTMDIETIAVIGAGERGREIACAALLAGYRTILEDVSESRLAQAVAWISNAANLDAEARSRLVVSRAIEEAVRDADLIIEAVAEEMEMKIEMFTIFDKFSKPGAILASTSSSLAIAELAAATFCPERCIGMRFVANVGSAGEIELVGTPETSEETIARCREFGRRMGGEISVVRDNEPGRPFEAPLDGRGKQDKPDASASEPQAEISAKGPIPA
jgi:3-hydroxyacyl-CoA dehydrogenase